MTKTLYNQQKIYHIGIQILYKTVQWSKNRCFYLTEALRRACLKSTYIYLALKKIINLHAQTPIG